MLQRAGLILVSLGLIAVVALISWHANQDVTQTSETPPTLTSRGTSKLGAVQPARTLIKPQERPGATAWGGLSWGASPAEVMALYPSASGDGRFISNLEVGGTQMGAVLTYEKNRLTDLTLEPSQAGCGRFDQFDLLLRNRYGEPDTGLLRRYWRTKTSFVGLMCLRGQLHVIYEDRAAATRRDAAAAAKAKEQSRGL